MSILATVHTEVSLPASFMFLWREASMAQMHWLRLHRWPLSGVTDLPCGLENQLALREPLASLPTMCLETQLNLDCQLHNLNAVCQSMEKSVYQSL